MSGALTEITELTYCIGAASKGLSEILAGPGEKSVNAISCKSPEIHVNAWLACESFGALIFPLGCGTDSAAACENAEDSHVGTEYT